MAGDTENEAKGYPYTHWDCPNCGEADEAEGDIKGETVECRECGAVVLIN